MLVPTTDEEMAEVVRSERNQGRSPDMAAVDHVRIGGIQVVQRDDRDRRLTRDAELAHDRQ